MTLADAQRTAMQSTWPAGQTDHLRPDESTMNRQTVSAFKPLAAALLAALGIVPLAAQAATIVVTSPGDTSVTGPTTCTLRQAIVSMNAGAISGTACTNSGGAFGSGDTINFDTGVFPGGSKITLASGALAVTAANLTIDATANVNVTIDGSSAMHVIYDTYNSGTAGSLTLNHLTVINGHAYANRVNYPFGNFGGGICAPYVSLTLSNSSVNGNHADYGGGGIFSGIGGSVTLTNSTVSANSTSRYGGGISGSGSVTLNNSTVSGNQGSNGGGGIYAKGSHLTLTNSTVSGNHTEHHYHIYAKGGGILAVGGRNNITLTNSTVSGNSAYYGVTPGGGIYSGTGSVLVINNSIVAGNTIGDIKGSFTGTNNLIGGSPMLGALANNGGPTQTLLPQAGSPAINAAPCLAGIATDQRGDPRPDWPSRNLATPCDIGSVEVGSNAAPTIVKSFSPKTVPLNGNSTLSFTVTNPNAVSASAVAFIDSLPTGVTLASNTVVGNCGGGVITPAINNPPAVASTVSLTGATLAANTSCTFSVSVNGITAGAQLNTTGSVSSAEGGPGGTASDTLTVIAAPTIAKSFNPKSVPLNGSSTLSFTVTNPNTASALGGVAFTDALPSGVKLASTAVTGSCGSGFITPTINSPPGSPSTVSLTGATLAASPAAGSSCQFSVSVTAISAGAQVNTTGAVSSIEGGTGGTATDTLTVLAVSNVTQSTPCMTTFVEGQSTMLDAAVTGFNPSGSVAFKNNATVLCSQALNSGHASCSTSSLTASTYSVIANYSGDANNTTATSQPLPLTVLSLADAVFRDAFEAGIVGCPVE